VAAQAAAGAAADAPGTVAAGAAAGDEPAAAAAEALGDAGPGLADAVPQLWQESSVAGLRVIAGRSEGTPAWVALDDATPHWLVGGHAGSGKTTFLLDVLVGLAARYSPDQLALYLLDYSGGSGFSGFGPTPDDPAWLPQARVVGTEPDREFGVAVLSALTAELDRRAAKLTQAGVGSFADLRVTWPGLRLPRIVAVIEDFQVLVGGDDALAEQAGALLEEVAGKGVAHGVHLILSSPDGAGVETLTARGEAVTRQFSQRVALPGGHGVLGRLNDAADALPLGSVLLNDAAGALRANREASFPDADPQRLRQVRDACWERRSANSGPPAVFAGHAEQHVEDDPTLGVLDAATRPRTALVGRCVDVGLPSARFELDASAGRNLAVLGSSPAGAGVLHAAVVSLARQHEPGRAAFVLAAPGAAAEEVLDAAAEEVLGAGHRCVRADVAGLRTELARLARVVGSAADAGGDTGPAEEDGAAGDTGPAEEDGAAGDTAEPGGDATEATYVVIWGVDGAGDGLPAGQDPASRRADLDDLRAVLRDGPARGVHVLGWWREARRLAEDLGESGRDDVAGLVALDVTAQELGGVTGDEAPDWTPRDNRALLIDRGQDRATLIVPFAGPARHAEGRS